MVSIRTSCIGTEGGPFWFQPPCQLLGEKPIGSACHTPASGLWLLRASNGLSAVLLELGQHCLLLGTGVPVSKSSIQVIFCLFLERCLAARETGTPHQRKHPWMSLIITLASCQFISGPEVGRFLNRNSVSLSSCTLWVSARHPIRDSQISTAISSFQAWGGSRTSHSESPSASFITRTSKQYDSRRHNPSVRADRLGSAHRIVSGLSFALLSWSDISPSAIISCREVLSSVTRASSASFFGHAFPFVLLLGRLIRSHVSYSSITAVVGVAR